MTYKEMEKLVLDFFKGTPFRKSYAIAFDGTAYRSGSTVSREVYISFERHRVEFTFGAPLSRDTTREWSYDGAPGEFALIDLIGLVNKLERLQKVIDEEEGNFSKSEGLALTIDELSNQMLLSRGLCCVVGS